jgi:hypothetical protein
MLTQLDLVSWPDAEIATGTERGEPAGDITIRISIMNNAKDQVALRISPKLAYSLVASVVETMGGKLTYPDMREA